MIKNKLDEISWIETDNRINGRIKNNRKFIWLDL